MLSTWNEQWPPGGKTLSGRWEVTRSCSISFPASPRSVSRPSALYSPGVNSRVFLVPETPSCWTRGCGPNYPQWQSRRSSRQLDAATTWPVATKHEIKIKKYAKNLIEQNLKKLGGELISWIFTFLSSLVCLAWAVVLQRSERASKRIDSPRLVYTRQAKTLRTNAFSHVRRLESNLRHSIPRPLVPRTIRSACPEINTSPRTWSPPFQLNPRSRRESRFRLLILLTSWPFGLYIF